jgi:hypothetical protein
VVEVIALNASRLTAIDEERHRCTGVGIVTALCLEVQDKRYDRGKSI